MNSGLAIAAITAILKNRIEDGLVQNTALSSMGNIRVTTLPPDQISVGVEGQPQLNLFLYQVSENRNADWSNPTSQHPPGIRDQSVSQLAVNLHYLITIYGTKDFQTEMLLGAVMQLMHQIPVLANAAIRQALQHVVTMNRSGLLAQAMTSDSLKALIAELGQIAIKPNLLDTEQMSRLWSLLQAAYRPSVAYQVSMISISAPETHSDSVPVSQDSQDVNDHPVIEKVTASPATHGVITPGCELILYGQNLQGDITKIRLNEDEHLLTPKISEDLRILLELPSTLSAGIHQIQVIHQTVLAPQSEFDTISNQATFKLY